MTFTSLLVLSLHSLARMTTQISKIKTRGMRKVTTDTHQRRNC